MEPLLPVEEQEPQRWAAARAPAEVRAGGALLVGRAESVEVLPYGVEVAALRQDLGKRRLVEVREPYPERLDRKSVV